MKVIRKIADFLLASYLFIATASFSLVLTTQLFSSGQLQLTSLSLLVFFSTLLIYNFHKVSGLFAGHLLSHSVILQQLKNIPGLTKLMTCLALAGLFVTGWFVHVKTLLLFFPAALITIAYSLPLLNVYGKKKRLREMFLVKITTVAFVWSFTTGTLPMIDSGMNLISLSSALIFAERFLFMFAICIPFEIRDMEQEKKWGNITLPIRAGVKRSKLIGLAALFLFILLVYYQSTHPELSGSATRHFDFAMYTSGLVAGFLIWISHAGRSNYFFRFFVDGTMQLQLLSVLLFNCA